jgi:hypothetical protein
MVAKKSVSVDIIKFALGRVRESPLQAVRNLSCVKAKKIIKPSFDRIIVSISYWLF